MSINLNFINRSSDTNNSSVVIFGQVVTTNLDEPVAALKVIDLRDVGDGHAFTIPAESNDSPLDLIWVGAAVAPDETCSPAGDITVEEATPLSLAGVASASIVMTGGDGAPLAFALTDVVTAGI
ncbi:hypothetical protein ACVWZA_001714 [Sphingomonas sp. UYAg733]